MARALIAGLLAAVLTCSVAGADWSPPERVGNAENSVKALFVGADGRALLLGFEVFTRDPGGAFHGQAPPDESFPFAHFAAAGDVVIGAWTEPDYTHDHAPDFLFGSVGTLRAPFAGKTLLSQDGSRLGPSSFPFPVAAAPNGYAVAVENRASGNDCYWLRAPDGHWNLRPEPLSPCLYTPPGYIAQRVAINTRGDVAVLLEHFETETIALSFRPAGGVFSAPVPVAPKRNMIAVDPDRYTPGLALDEQGNTVAAFDAGDGVVTARRVADGPVGAKLVAPGGRGTYLAADESGRLLLTWAQPAGSGHDIKAMRGTVAGGLGGGALSIAHAPGARVNTTGAVASDGRGVAAWTSGTPGKLGDVELPPRTVAAAALPASGPAGRAVTLTTCATIPTTAAGISDAGESLVAYDSDVLVDDGGGLPTARSHMHVAIHDRRGGRVGQPTAPCGRRPAGRPRLTRLRVRPATLRPGGRVRVSYRLSAPATVRFTFERLARCPGRPGRPGRTCRTYRRVPGSLTRRSGRGNAGFAFRGRVRNRTLRAGRYRLIARPKSRAGAGGSVRRAFTVAR